MRRGNLTERINILVPEIIKSETGSPRQTWEDKGAYWAEKSNFSGRGVLENSELFSEYVVRLNVDDLVTVKTGWQIIYLGDKYSVTAIDYVRKRRMKVLTCTKINP